MVALYARHDVARVSRISPARRCPTELNRLRSPHPAEQLDQSSDTITTRQRGPCSNLVALAPCERCNRLDSNKHRAGA